MRALGRCWLSGWLAGWLGEGWGAKRGERSSWGEVAEFWLFSFRCEGDMVIVKASCFRGSEFTVCDRV